MIIYALHMLWSILSPEEAYPVLKINANAELPVAIACQGFQMVSWRNPHLFKMYDRVKLIKFSASWFP